MSAVLKEPVSYPAPQPPKGAHVIRSDEEALAIARELAAEFATGAAERDRERRLPVAELDRFSQSGLWGITVPREYGGAFVSNVTLAEVIKTISEADPSLGQVPQNHLYMVEALRLDGSEWQKQTFFQLVLQGYRFGNAFSEIGTKDVNDVRTRIAPAPGGGWLLSGRKFYSSGALLAHWVPVIAKDPQDRTVIVFVERHAPGLTVVNDWSSFGQRTTASGTTILDNVHVPDEHVLVHQLAFERPTPMGPVAQIIQAAVDVGIASAALKDLLAFVRQQARPWIDANVAHGFEDPLTLHAVGDLVIRQHANEALLQRAGTFLDRATAGPTEQTVAEASIAVAESKALSAETVIAITNKLFELGGTRSTLESFNFDRHWRNGRTHTLHDPARWKYFHVGNFFLNGVNPPRHPWL